MKRGPIIELLDAIGRARAARLGTTVVDNWDDQLDALQALLDEPVEFMPPDPPPEDPAC